MLTTLCLARYGLVLMALLASIATANPIRYTFTTAGSGSVGGQAFINAPIVITLVGDTNGIFRTPIAITRNPVRGTIAIGGIGTATIEEPVWACSRCGGGSPNAGMERGPLDPIFSLHGLFFAKGGTIYICDLEAYPSISGLIPELVQEFPYPHSNLDFTNLATSLGPITITTLAPISYQATLLVASPIPTTGPIALTVLGILIALVAAALLRPQSDSCYKQS